MCFRCDELCHVSSSQPDQKKRKVGTCTTPLYNDNAEGYVRGVTLLRGHFFSVPQGHSRELNPPARFRSQALVLSQYCDGNPQSECQATLGQNNHPLAFCPSEVQSHSRDWWKPGIENWRTPLPWHRSKSNHIILFPSFSGVEPRPSARIRYR